MQVQRKSSDPIPPQQTVDGSRWRLPFGVADVLFLVLALGMIQRSGDAMLDDPGLGWHLRNIDVMLQQGKWLTEDPYSVTTVGNTYFTNQWLGDLTLWLGWQWGDLEGIAVVTTLILVTMFWLLFRMMIKDNVPVLLALLWTFMAALGTSLSWVARPNLLTIGFLMITAWVIERYHRNQISARKTYWLLPLMILWTNTHGGFLAGLLTIGIALFIDGCLCFAATTTPQKQQAKVRAIHLSKLLAGCCLCTLINPYGWNLYPWIFQLLGNDFFMNLNSEWQSPNFHAVGAFRYELLILIVPLLIAFSKKRPSLVALAFTIFWLHFALSGQRYVALWVVVSIPMIARLSAELPFWKNLSEKLEISQDLRHLLSSKPRVHWLGPLLIAIVMLAWARFENNYSRHAPQHIPTVALEHLLENHQGEKVFHHYNWGGWLTWHGWPTLKTWIDDRNEVQGESHTRQYLKLINGQSDWQTYFTNHNVQVICIPTASALAHQIAGSNRWQEEYRDDQVVIYYVQPSMKKSLARE